MTAGSGGLRVDADAWRRHGGQSSFVFSHGLGAHELLEVGALAELADRLPPTDVETMAAEQAPVHADRKPGQVRGESPGDLMRSVAERKAWMSLLRIEQDPRYRHLLERLLAEAGDAMGSPAGWSRVEGYVFVSAPEAVTPAHIDHEHNLYFQIRGTKRFTVGSCPTPEEEHRLLEGFYSGAYGATAFYPTDPVTYVLGPGDGLYVPPAAVHLVENGDEASTSLSVVFHTPDLDLAAKVYALNADLRRVGLHPRPPGERARLDAVKAAVVDLWRRARAGGRRPSPGG